MQLSAAYTVMLLASLLCAALRGEAAALSAAALEGAGTGVTLSLSLAGTLCLWSGVAKVWEQCGVSRRLSALLRPLLKKLFPDAMRDERAAGSICSNLAANLLGLGNAATPLGVAAVCRMRELSGKDRATDEMCRFIVLNTASIQLIPATVAALRAQAGAASPFDILPAVWITSLGAAAVGLSAAALFANYGR
ncbi:MAG: spore maturation protein A [Oscillospiraceae bacterium]|nr:spore maturation protein A [Oscillospiraceae bacterium]MBR3850235.1 spore maturation protein A [Oscillospiraceae bacterium]